MRGTFSTGTLSLFLRLIRPVPPLRIVGVRSCGVHVNGRRIAHQRTIVCAHWTPIPFSYQDALQFSQRDSVFSIRAPLSRHRKVAPLTRLFSRGVSTFVPSNHPRRSVLYMPGSNARAMEKGKKIPADGLILDLEDAVAINAKVCDANHGVIFRIGRSQKDGE